MLDEHFLSEHFFLLKFFFLILFFQLFFKCLPKSGNTDLCPNPKAVTWRLNSWFIVFAIVLVKAVGMLKFRRIDWIIFLVFWQFSFFFLSYKVKKNDGVSKIGDYHWSWLKRQRVPNGRKRLFLDDFDHLLMMRVWKIDEREAHPRMVTFSVFLSVTLVVIMRNILRKIHFPNPFSHGAFQNTSYTSNDFSLPSVWQMICLFLVSLSPPFLRIFLYGYTSSS